MDNELKYLHEERPWMKYYDTKLINSITSPSSNLVEYLKKKNKDRDKYIAETYYGKQTTYQDFFDKKVDGASKALSQLGIKCKDRILYLLPNIPESGHLYLGATQLGAVSDFYDPRPDSTDLKANAKKMLETIIEEKVQYIVALDICYLAMLKPIEKELKDLGIKQIVTVSATDSMNLSGKISYIKEVIDYNKLKNLKTDQAIKKLKSYQAVLKKVNQMKTENELFKEAVKTSELEIIPYSDLFKQSVNTSFIKVNNGDLLNYIGHTSGTSGNRPKPIPLTNNNQISGTDQLFMAGANFKEKDKILHELPFFSPLGTDNNYILNLASGSNNIHIPEFDISEFGYLILKHHPNVILGTPAWISALPQCSYLDKVDLSCVNRIIYGGGSMLAKDQEKVDKWLKEHGSKAEVESGHGMSEYCGCGSYAQKEWNIKDSIGIPLPDTIYTLVDPEIKDKLVPIGFKPTDEKIKGEIAVSSKAVTEGKLDDRIITPHQQLDGKSYIRTGDIAQADRNGVFYYQSRKDRSFTRFDGYKYKSFEGERIIKQNANVKDCIIVPYFDEAKRGNMPLANIILNNENQTEEEKKSIIEEIIYTEFINNKETTSRQIPSRIKLRSSMPLTKNSKVSYKDLEKEGLTGEEYIIDIEETNLSVGEIKIYSPNEVKGKIKVKK